MVVLSALLRGKANALAASTMSATQIILAHPSHQKLRLREKLGDPASVCTTTALPGQLQTRQATPD